MDVQAKAPSANPVAGLLFEIPQFSSEKIFGKAALAELQSLAREKDPELRRDGLISLAARLEGSGREEAAKRVYALLPEDKKAAARKAALEGQGDFGAAFETQLRRLRREALQPRAILPMVAGSAVYGMARSFLLGRLLSHSSAGFLTRGLGARSLASGGAFLTEVPTFALTARALHDDSAAPGLSQDLAHAALTLGALKGFGALGSAAAQRWRVSPLLFGQTSMFGGLLAAQALEEGLGIVAPREGSEKFASALNSMLSLSVGARIGSALLGNGFARFRGELELRSGLAEWRAPGSDSSHSPALQAAGAGRLAPSSVRPWESLQSQSRGGSALVSQAEKEIGLAKIQELIKHELLSEAWKAFPQFKELKKSFTSGEFATLAFKIAPLFDDPAMNLRAYAFIFLDRLVPGLDPGPRNIQLSRIDRGMADPEPWVRELAVQAFDHNAAFWPREELIRRIPELQRLTRDPEQMVREAAYRGLVRMTEFLAPEQRMPHLRGLARYFARSGEVNHLKNLPFNRALRSLEPAQRLQIARQFERALPAHAEDFHFVPFFGDMIWRLDPKHQAGRIEALEGLYNHPDVLARIHAMTAVDNNMDRLPRKDWPARIRQFEIAMRSRESRIRERAVTILGGLYSSEPSFFEGRRIRSFDLRLKDSDPSVRQAALEAQQRVALALDSTGRSALLGRLLDHWSNTRGEGRGETESAVQSIYGKMKVRESLRWELYLKERFGSRIPEGLKINRPD